MKLWKIFTVTVLLLISTNGYSQNYRILESTNDHLKLEFNFEGKYSLSDTLIDGKTYTFVKGDDYTFRNTGQPWLPDVVVNIGIPHNAKPAVKILNIDKKQFDNKFILPYPDSLSEPLNKIKLDRDSYGYNKLFPGYAAKIASSFEMRYVRAAVLSISPFQFNPVTRQIIFNKRIVVLVDFNAQINKAQLVTKLKDELTDNFVRSSLVNKDAAFNFIGKSSEPKTASADSSNWYDPNKDYYKIFVKDKGVYRVTYSSLINAGISSSSGIKEGKLELYNNGKHVPIDIVDANSDGQFDEGDYFQFVGFPPPPSPYCTLNIYNNQNVYWFSYQADSAFTYNLKDGQPKTFSNEVYSNQNTLHFEKDLDYEPLGYAPDGKRDFWFWDKAEARNGQATYIFRYDFQRLDDNINENLPDASVKVNVHGMTTGTCNFSHNAFVNLNGRRIGSFAWNGQEAATYEKKFKFGFYTDSQDSIRLLWNNNYFEIGVDGNICNDVKDDIIRVNWFEFTYWRWNRVNGKHYEFKSIPGKVGPTVYFLWNWFADNMKIYMPERGVMINNPLVKNDADKAVLFEDTAAARTEYFCVSDDYYMTPLSIEKDESSDLHNKANGADYVIIYHPKFKSVANRLAVLRSNNLPGFSSPRIKMVSVQDIYDEFSAGLLDPYALQKFAKYAFENWQQPAPTYIALLGDMSFDYRHIYTSSRNNYIPSMPEHTLKYGLAASDNKIVTVEGDDIIPDMIIGRLSCETVDEGNILVDKLENYPSENSKEWKQNVLLIASGMDADDEQRMGFNDKSIQLENSFLKPNGVNATKVFRYPNRPEYDQYQGTGPEIRAAFDKGAVLANYYGHGGGAQWDLVFTNDDIYQLNNGGMLPLILSVTCYTAHYDNQDIFGEKFNKIRGKGSIGFFGSSGVTWWQAGTMINEMIFDEIFNKKNYVFGSAMVNAKTRVNPYNVNIADQIGLLTLLGDPALELAIPKKPDFAVNSSDINITPRNPVKGDTVAVTVHLKNFGITFPGDSVSVQLFADAADSSGLIGTVKLPSFGENDSVAVRWIPQSSGLINLIAKVNEVDTIDEDDHSDNTAYASFAVYNFGEPNLIKPLNGYFSKENKIEFSLSDIGSYFGKEFYYYIELDTTRALNSPAKIVSSNLAPVKGVVSWHSPLLAKGKYFWHAVIYNESDTNFSAIRSFTIGDLNGNGYFVSGKQLTSFAVDNVNYSDSLKSLVLNTKPLPPHPDNKSFLDSVNIKLPDDTRGMTAFATDGEYFYFGHLPFYRGDSKTKIYKIGSGIGGSERGKNYGAIPGDQFYIRNSMVCYSDGYLYIADGSANSLLRVNPATGDTSRVNVAGGLLPSFDGLIKNGGYYLSTDGRYIYSLSSGYGSIRKKYILRTLDPQNGWSRVGDDIIFGGSSQELGFSGFIVVDGYLITYESYDSGYMRRFRLSDGAFEEEWVSHMPFWNYYTMAYDWKNNFVYFSTFRPGYTYYQPSFHRYTGVHQESAGRITTEEIGPALKWNYIKYDMEDRNSGGTYNAVLLGKTAEKSRWDTLAKILPDSLSLSNNQQYRYLQIAFTLVDSSKGFSEPLKLKSVEANYISLPEVSMTGDEFTVSGDSLLQGFPVDINYDVHNIGYSDAQNLKVSLYLNDADTAFYSNTINLKVDSTAKLGTTINTDHLIFNNKLKLVAESPSPEFYTFNNILEKSFYVARDSLKPTFNITFDGKEAISGDIVSAKPDIQITLKDNSPLPLDTTFFTILYDNEPISFSRSDLKYSYNPYPNSEMKINWNPELKDGKHSLAVLAKDASGNFFDSTTYTVIFYVYNNPDLINVYNYPNPFSDDTYFTFELHGRQVPEELRIKIYTVAGRLIREIKVPPSEMRVGFNRVFWNGRDEDGDTLANGVYFYKIITKINDTVKTVTQKLAKVK